MWTNAFINGEDLHRSVAAKIFHKEISQVTGDERKKAKSCNFGLNCLDSLLETTG